MAEIRQLANEKTRAELTTLSKTHFYRSIQLLDTGLHSPFSKKDGRNHVTRCWAVFRTAILSMRKFCIICINTVRISRWQRDRKWTQAHTDRTENILKLRNERQTVSILVDTSYQFHHHSKPGWCEWTRQSSESRGLRKFFGRRSMYKPTRLPFASNTTNRSPSKHSRRPQHIKKTRWKSSQSNIALQRFLHQSEVFTNFENNGKVRVNSNTNPNP